MRIAKPNEAVTGIWHKQDEPRAENSWSLFFDWQLVEWFMRIVIFVFLCWTRFPFPFFFWTIFFFFKRLPCRVLFFYLSGIRRIWEEWKRKEERKRERERKIEREVKGLKKALEDATPRTHTKYTFPLRTTQEGKNTGRCYGANTEILKFKGLASYA